MHPFEATSSESWVLPQSGAQSLFVRTANSPVRVAGTAGDAIEVQVTKTVRAATESAARAFLEQIQVERQRQDDRWMVEATWPTPLPHGVESAGAALDIRAPSAMHVEAESRNGAVEAAGLAEARLRTSNGSVTARQIDARTDARTCNGAVHVDACAGPVEASTENGRIEVRQARGAVRAVTCNGAIHVEECAGPVELRTENARIEVRRTQDRVSAQTCNGGIRIDDCPGPVEARTSSGEIAIRHARGPVAARTSDGRIEADLEAGDGATHVELLTSNGPIEARLPANVSARLTADTSNARITLERPGGRVEVASPHLDTVLGSLDSVLGDSEGSVRLRTSNGQIRIRVGA